MKKSLRFILIFLGSVLSIALTGCSPWVVFNQGNVAQWMTLSTENTIGQTFIAEYSGLQAVYFTLKPLASGEGALLMHLRSDSASSNDLSTVIIPLSEIDKTKQYRFDFSAIKNSNEQYYYTFLSIEGNGSVSVGAGPVDSYQNGSAYQDHQPIDAQLTFSLDYDRAALLMGIVEQLLRWTLIFCAAFVFLVIPGWALLSALWKGWDELSSFEKLPLAIGTSMAFYVLFVLLTFLLHIQLGSLYVWFPVFAGGIVLVALVFKRRSKRSAGQKFDRGESQRSSFSKSSLWVNISLTIILILIALTRFWSTRGLEQPMWNDSFHHTVVTQLILDHQGLFTSWLPYAQYQTYSMHFGFPLVAALLSWITAMSSGMAVLYMGQILNIFAPLALYPLAVRLFHGNKIGGVITVLAAGLLAQMPAYYINWGRYAQLAGQVILPIAMWMIWEVLDNLHEDRYNQGWFNLPWLKIIISASVTAGMVLFEFRMIFIIATFVISMLIAELIKQTPRNFHKWLREVWSVLLVGVISLLIFLPWGLRAQGSRLIDYTGIGAAVNDLVNLVTRDYQTWLNIRFYIPLGLIIISLLGIVWAVIKKNWRVASLGLWVILMASVYAMIVLHLPWAQYVQSFAVLISLYIPASLLTGYVAGSLAEKLTAWPSGKIIVFSTIILLGIIGAWSLRNIANPSSYSFVTRPDSRAMQWIKENTPANARFLIEGRRENWATNVIGTDAGWWIPLLAGRQNTIPPQYAMANEQPIEPNYTQNLVDLQDALEKNSPASEDGIKQLCDNGISYVYIGQKSDSPTSNHDPLFTPLELASSAKFKLRYHKDQVYIYSVENACEQ